MATFRVGQKVRIIAGIYPEIIGDEVEILGPLEQLAGWPAAHHRISTPPHAPHSSMWYAEPRHLAPLTDPKADAFIESIKKLQPLKEPVSA